MTGEVWPADQERELLMELPPNPYIDIPSLLQWKIGVKREFQHLLGIFVRDEVVVLTDPV